MTDRTTVDASFAAPGEVAGGVPVPRCDLPEPTATPTLADWQALALKEVQGRDLTWATPEGATSNQPHA